MHISKLFFDADSLVYVNAWAAQQTHYRVFFKNTQYLEQDLRYQKDYHAFLKEQRESDRQFFHYEKVEHTFDLNLATSSIDKTIFFIRKKLGAVELKFFITADNKTNNRYNIATILPYKGNRQDSARPIYYNDCRQHLIDRWNATVIIGEEADDAVVQQQYDHYKRLIGNDSDCSDVTCIAHIDKDINQCPGYHYNITKSQLYWVSELNGLRFFYTQLLTGDSSVDNIPGLYYITGQKVMQHLKEPLLSMTNEADMYKYVYTLYDKHKPSHIPLILKGSDEPEMIEYPGTTAILSELGQLLWMRRTPMEVWKPPV